jgi:hypothetical protein
MSPDDDAFIVVLVACTGREYFCQENVNGLLAALHDYRHGTKIGIP